MEESTLSMELDRLYDEKDGKILIVSPEEIHRNAMMHGWWDKRRYVPELLCLVHSEVSEALEAYRNNIPRGETGWIGEELADVIIRVFDVCEHLKIDIAKEVAKKHEYNKTRPMRHGGKKC